MNVFISYSHADEHWADLLREQLRHFGTEIKKRIGASQHILTGEAAGNEQGHWIYRILSRFVD